MTLGWVELVRAYQQLEYGQSVPCCDQLAHRGADVGVQATPHYDDGAVERVANPIKVRWALMTTESASTPSPRTNGRGTGSLTRGDRVRRGPHG
jgi:hypothetical protein